MDFSKILSSLGGIGFLLAYLDYNRAVLKGDTKPNGATWAIWSSIALVSVSSYFASTGDFWKSILSFLNILLCVFTFVLALIRGKYKPLDVTDWIALGLGIIAVIVWAVFRSATYGNMLVQVSIFIGFIPTWRSIWDNPLCEKERPWTMWSVSYALLFIVVILRWRGQYTDIVYPANCFVLHASVPVLCRLRIRYLLS